MGQYLKAREFGGDCDERGRSDWVKIESFALSQSSQAGSTLRIEMLANRTTPVLMKACATGAPFREVLLEMTDDAGIVVFRARFKEALVEECALRVSPGDIVPLDRFTFNCAEMKVDLDRAHVIAKASAR